jgi:hypothetical protein
VRRVTDINSAAAMAERRCGRLKCGKQCCVDIWRGWPFSAQSRQGFFNAASWQGASASGRGGTQVKQRTIPPPIGVGVDPLRLLGEKPSRDQKKSAVPAVREACALGQRDRRAITASKTCVFRKQLFRNLATLRELQRDGLRVAANIGMSHNGRCVSPPMPILARNARVRSCVPQGFIYTYTDYLVFCRCLTSLHP